MEQVAQITVSGTDFGEPSGRAASADFDELSRIELSVEASGRGLSRAGEPTVGEALRIAMASCVRFYCTPDEEAILERMEASSAQIPSSTGGIVLDFQSPQDVPTSLPLQGWFGPLRGCEEMKRVERLYLILEWGQWAEVIARSADGTWSCWKSNWEIEPPPP